MGGSARHRRRVCVALLNLSVRFHFLYRRNAPDVTYYYFDAINVEIITELPSGAVAGRSGYAIFGCIHNMMDICVINPAYIKLKISSPRQRFSPHTDIVYGNQNGLGEFRYDVIK